MISTQVDIRPLTTTDLQALQRISKQTFMETYSGMNTEENIKKYLDEHFSRDKLHAELEEPRSKFYFAILDEQVVGYLKLNFGKAQTALKDRDSVEIERIYVLKEFQGKSIGKLLFEKALEVATYHQAKYIWLGVWEKNLKALSFYRKNGFRRFKQHVFWLGDEEQIDLMMKRKISNGKMEKE